MPTVAVPDFFLYGEIARPVDADFMHVEQLDDRSRSSAWLIPPHAHSRLQQLFLVETGGGTVTFEGRPRSFEAPAVVVIPAGVAHGFQWRSESSGLVLTFAVEFLETAVAQEPAFERLFDAADVLAVSPDEEAQLATLLGRMMLEAPRLQPGAAAYIHGAALGVLTVLLRRVLRELQLNGCAPHAQADLVAKFRREVERSFREAPSIAELARTLGVSVSRLRAACVAVVGEPPVKLLQARALAEARRLLLYTRLPITQVAEASGFHDSAYFSRVFAQQVGTPPRAFRNGVTEVPKPDGFEGGDTQKSSPALKDGRSRRQRHDRADKVI